MSLDVSLEQEKTMIVDVFDANITHNLGGMAEEAGIYKHLWRPEELGLYYAEQIIVPLHNAVLLMKSDPNRFKKHDSPNGWGVYEDFLNFVEKYLKACEENRNSKIRVSR